MSVCAATDITSIPRERLPWTAIAVLMQSERLPIDYGRRWPIVLRNAELLKENGITSIPATSNPIKTLLAEHHNANRAIEAHIERNLQLIEKLIEG